jgi:hypothetical protein
MAEATAETPPIPPRDGRKLEVKGWYCDRGDTAINECNFSMKSLHCVTTREQLTITFDVDRGRWNSAGVGFPMPLRVRLLDRNGEYLTHFQTVESFVFPPTTPMFVDFLDDAHKQYHYVALKYTGNRVTYPVNVRDLRDARIVEVGFVRAKQ